MATNFNMTNLFGNLIYVVNISVNTKSYGVFSNAAQAKTAVGGKNKSTEIIKKNFK